MNVDFKNPYIMHNKNDHCEISFIGGFWFEEEYYSNQSACLFLMNYLSKLIDGKDLTNLKLLINSLNGSFMFCVKTDDSLVAVVDRLRSIPIYYSEDVLVDRISGCYSLDEIGKIEFLSSGYTVNNRTIFNKWKSLLPGELLYWSKQRNEIVLDRYYTHSHNINNELTEEQIREQLYEISQRVIARTVNSVQNKKVMISLSGGYDSRYIACMLKEYGIENIVAYTYGNANSYEVETSKMVAEKLGFEWNFIEYTDKLWHQMINTGIVDDFIDFSFWGDGVPCLQDIPALFELSRKYNPKEYCILPGYCGDLFGGSYLFPYTEEGISPNKFGKYLYERHFTFRRNKRAEKSSIIKDLKPRGYEGGNLSYDMCASLNEDWFIKHKVAKFVVNAVRMFEFFGYEWRLPLWDNELMELWYSVPLKYRGLEKNLYREQLFECFFSKYDVLYSKPASFSKKPSTGIVKKMKERIKWANSFMIVNKGIHIIPTIDINNFSTLDQYMLANIKNRSKLNYGHLNSNAYIARKVLETIETSS